MNKFRHQQEDPRKNLRHEELQLIGVLDKCTQILREDRVHIRNRIKEGDSEVLSFFKPLKNINLQQLQINLRKYLNQLKANLKMQQLIKFKENHLEAGCSCEVRWVVNEKTKHMLGSTTSFCNKDRPVEHSKEVFRDHPVHENRAETNQWKPTLARHDRCNSMSQLPQPPSTIFQHDRKKSFNGRDSSQLRQNSSTKQLIKPQEAQPQALSNHKRSASSTNLSMRHARTQSNNVRTAPRREQHQPAPRHHNASTGSAQKSDKKPTRNTKEQISKPIQSAPRYEWDAKHTTSCYQPTNNQNHSEPENVVPQYRPLEHDTLPAQTSENSFNKYRGATYDNLFTSPELLFECRKYIEKSRGPLPRISAEDLPSNVYKQQQAQQQAQQQPTPVNWQCSQPVSNLQSPISISESNSPQLMEIVPKTHMKLDQIPTLTIGIEPAHEDFKQAQGDTESYNISAVPSTTPISVTPLDSRQEIIQINLQSRTESCSNTVKSKKELPDLSEYYAQDIIEVLFQGKDSPWILAAGYGYTVYSNFADTYPFERLFQAADTDCDGKVNINQLGDILDKTAMKKPNPVRQLFSLLDMQKAGRVSYQQFTRFLNQISESEQADFQQARKAAQKVFRFADVQGSGQISYWSLYLTKSSWQFQEFSGYLEQFEFSIEP